MINKVNLNNHPQTKLYNIAAQVSDAVEFRPLHVEPSHANASAQYQTLHLSTPLTCHVQTIAQQLATATRTLLWASLGILLSRYSDQGNVIVVSSVDGPEYQVNIQTIYLPHDITLSDAIQQIHLALQDKKKDNAISLELIQTFLEQQPHSHKRHLPLCILPNFADQSLIPYEDLFGILLTLDIQQDNTLVGTIRYNRKWYKAERLHLIWQHLAQILNTFSGDLTEKLYQLPLLTIEEKAIVVDDWNDTQKTYANHCLHTRFAQQARQTPNAAALIFSDQIVTYGELDRRSNQLAYKLIASGVYIGSYVGVCFDRSTEMLVAILGILKAGAAYVPLDPSLPPERLEFMQTDAQICHLIAHPQFQDLFLNWPIPITYLDTDWSQVRQYPDTPLQTANAHPTSAAYVAYTSGSTGVPKGVIVSHQAVNRLVLNTNYITISSEDFVAHASNTAFDAATFEIWGALLNGAKLVSVSKDEMLSPYTLAQILQRCNVTVLFVTTALFNQIIADNPSAFQTVRCLLFGGEAVNSNRVGELLDNSPPERLLHVYGPTENTTFTTYHAVEESPINGAAVPIGRPVTNSQTYILDRFLNLMPTGFAGEIYIGGDGLATSYLNRPRATAEKFVPNPFSSVNGSRLYNSGDIARFNQAGAIEFIGRRDHQVKIRGFRVELDEIILRLEKHPIVQDATVLLQEDQVGNKHLVGYAVADLAAYIDRSWDEERIDEWRGAWDEMVYSEISSETFAENDQSSLVGWVDSDTRSSFSRTEMVEQITQTVARIRSLAPKNILEIGCGTGLLLFPLLRHCDQYDGTDISSKVLTFIENGLDSINVSDRAQVRLWQRPAHDFSALKQQYDVVVLNSVVQYFPSVTYLLEVLKGALALLTPGGSIFMGDIRHLGLAEMFYVSAELRKAESAISVEALWQQVEQRKYEEQELLLDPTFFKNLQTTFPQITAVEVQLKRGHSQNELTRYRYDVTLHTAPLPSVAHSIASFDWEEELLTQSKVEQILSENASDCVLITTIPNVRLAHESNRLHTAQQLFDGDTTTFIDMRENADLLSDVPSPESFWVIGEAYNYQTIVTYAVDSGPSEYLHVLYYRNGLPIQLALTTQSSEKYANTPSRHRLANQLINQMYDRLSAELPDYMLPSNILILEEFPLTANGKIDRRTLRRTWLNSKQNKQSPSPSLTPSERLVGSIWQSLLNTSHTDTSANFFDLGGNSLSAIQFIGRVREIFDVELSISKFLTTPTIQGVVDEIIEQRGGHSDLVNEIALIANQLHNLSEHEVEAMLKTLER